MLSELSGRIEPPGRPKGKPHATQPWLGLAAASPTKQGDGTSPPRDNKMNGNEMNSLSPTSGNHVVVMVTADSEEQAKRICDILLERKVIACANIVRGVESFFWWKGKVDHSRELLLLMKSRSELLDEIVRLVRENHSYDVPEVVALPLVGGNPEYLRWIDDSVEINQKGDRS